MDWSHHLQINQMLLNCGKFSFFCFPCSISALCPTQSGSEQNTAQSKHAEQSTSSAVCRAPTKCNQTVTCNATFAYREGFPPLCAPPSAPGTMCVCSPCHQKFWPTFFSHLHVFFPGCILPPCLLDGPGIPIILPLSHLFQQEQLCRETVGWGRHFTCKVQEKAVIYFWQLSSGFHSRSKLVPLPELWDLRLEC